MALGLVFYGVLLAITLWRLSLWQQGLNVSWLYLAAMAVVLLVMTMQGYLGGELVYRYGVEVEQAHRELPEREANSTPPLSTSSSPSGTATREKGERTA